MRLWHWKLLPFLPKSQLLSQKRECDLIWKDLANGKQTNHILINYIWEYENYEYELAMYYIKLNREFTNRNYEFNFSKNYKTRYLYNDKYVPFKYHHTDNYLIQCYYNLEEKYIRKQKDFDSNRLFDMATFIEKEIGKELL